MSPGIIVWLAALGFAFFVASMGAAGKGKGAESESSEGKVPALGLVIEIRGRIYVMADAEERWVFPLPQGHGFLFYEGEDEAIWAPTLKQLVTRYLRDRLRGGRYVLRQFMEELKKERKLGNKIGINYWEQQVREYAGYVERLETLLGAVEAGEAEMKLVKWSDLRWITSEREEVEAI